MKKIVRIFAFMFAFMLVFVSCGKKTINDPTKVCVELVKADYYVDAYFNEDSFDDYLLSGMSSRGIYCIIDSWPIDNESEKYSDWNLTGLFYFCDTKEDAKKLEDKWLDAFDEDDAGDLFKNGVVRRFGKTLFVGCEDVLEDINVK